MISFWPFGCFFIFNKLRICGPKCWKHVQEIFMQKICQVVYKNLCTHFLHYWFFIKIFMHNYIHMWQMTTTMQMIIIWIIQYVSFKFIPCKFNIWKTTKTKSLRLCPKSGTSPMNMPLTRNVNPLHNYIFNLGFELLHTTIVNQHVKSVLNW
jgi:hypothetical protein